MVYFSGLGILCVLACFLINGLADQESNTYGGVYTWKDRQAMDTFSESSLFNDVANNPNFANFTSKDFCQFFPKARYSRRA